jgi:AcrR family transcriptional regulator
MKHPDTKQRLLNAAKSLFAQGGYQATSMRAITGSAGVNLASANYHFGSKEALLEAVFERHIKPINEVRLKRLKGLKDESRRLKQKPEVLEILRAYIEPTVQLKEVGKGATNFGMLIGRAFVDPDETVRKIFLRLMKPVSQLMLELLGNALPELPKEVILWRFHFVIGAVSIAMSIYRNPKFKSTKITSEINLDLLADLLIAFTQAGMEAPMSKKQFAAIGNAMGAGY